MVQGQYPQITHGLGKLTPEVWRRLMDLLRNYEQFNRDERSTPSGGRSSTANQFLATIDDHVAVAGEYPEGFNMRAIGSFIDDADLDVVVCMYEIIDTLGAKRWVFSLANSHDGECT